MRYSRWSPLLNVLIHYTNFDSPVGTIADRGKRQGPRLAGVLASPPAGAARIERAYEQLQALPELAANPRRRRWNRLKSWSLILTQLRQYFAGERREFTVPLDLHGTEFQLRCWHALLKNRLRRDPNLCAARAGCRIAKRISRGWCGQRRQSGVDYCSLSSSYRL